MMSKIIKKNQRNIIKNKNQKINCVHQYMFEEFKKNS